VEKRLFENRYSSMKMMGNEYVFVAGETEQVRGGWNDTQIRFRVETQRFKAQLMILTLIFC
jgi:hypothetical protein